MEDSQPQFQIFLSYAKPDQVRVLEVYEYLIINGYPNTWIDCRKLLPGQFWELEIEKNLRKSDIVIFFLSHLSVNRRGYAQKELKTAIKYLDEKLEDDIYIIPIKLDSDVIVPASLSEVQWLDINSSDSLTRLKKSVDQQTQRLGFGSQVITSEYGSVIITKKSFQEQWDGLPGYECEFSIPIFKSETFPNLNEISRLIDGQFIKILHGYRINKFEQSPDYYNWADNQSKRTNSYNADYTDISHINYYLGVMYRIFWYGAGAAHPNSFYLPFNFLLNPLIQIEELEYFFEFNDPVFSKIQEFTRNTLLEKKEGLAGDNDIYSTGSLSEDLVKRGTETWQHFHAYIFSRKGLELYFAPYQIASYSEGTHHVTVPYQVFKEYLKPIFINALNLKYL